MATTWQTLEEAALTLGISSRTLHRRIAKGEFQSRMENGRREVLVSIADPAPSAMSDTPVTPIHQQQGGPIDDLPEDAREMVLALHEDRLRRTDLAVMAYQQSVTATAATAHRAQLHSRIAWITAGGLTLAAALSAIWTTHRVTRAQAEVEQLHAQVRQLSDTADTRARQLDTLRVDAESAKVAAAKAEGELSATKAQIAQVAKAQDQALADARRTIDRLTLPTTKPAATQPLASHP